MMAELLYCVEDVAELFGILAYISYDTGKMPSLIACLDCNVRSLHPRLLHIQAGTLVSATTAV
jgi:hypothetical protein